MDVRSNGDSAPIDVFNARQNMEQGALAGAISTDDRDPLSGVDA
jgi:hypothetical protein